VQRDIAFGCVRLSVKQGRF